jgi:hypothetical protein
MKLVEQFTQGKMGDDALNEDALIVTPHFKGIADGATDFAGRKIGGISSGRFASRIVTDAVARLDPDMTAFEAVPFLTAEFRKALDHMGAGDARPSSALLLYSGKRKEIWRLADSPFMVDGVENQKPIPTIGPLTEFRRLIHAAHEATGVTEDELLKNDPVAALWTQVIPRGEAIVNRPGPFGFGMINGDAVPAAFIEVHPVPQAKDIVLASDGYPRLFGTMDETEAHLQGVIARDPRMVREYPQVKGVKPGCVSFDDRSYMRLGR